MCIRGGVLGVEQLDGVPAQLGDQRAGQPRLLVVVGRRGQLQQLVQAGAVGRVLREAALDQRADAVRHLGQVLLALHDPQHQRGHRRVGVTERRPAGGREGQHRAEAEDVAGRREHLAAALLGRHEPGRPHGRAGPRQAVTAALQGAGDAEVDDARPVDGDHHIGRLEVAVHEPGGVDVPQRPHQAVPQDAQGAFRQPAVRLGDDLVQRGSRDIPRGHPGRLGLGVAAQDRRGPVAADRARGLDLLLEPSAELGLCRELRLDQLDGHCAPAVGAGEINTAHSAGAQFPQQPVVAHALGICRPERFHAVVLLFAPVSPTRIRAPVHNEGDRGRTVIGSRSCREVGSRAVLVTWGLPSRCGRSRPGRRPGRRATAAGWCRRHPPRSTAGSSRRRDMSRPPGSRPRRRGRG